MTDENDLTAAYMAGLADRDDAMRKACVAAAAKALRDASVDLVAAFDGYARDVSAWLRSRADAIEAAAKVVL